MKKHLFIFLCFLVCQIPAALSHELIVLDKMVAETQEEKPQQLESVYDLFALALAELNEKLRIRIGFVPFTGSEYLGRGRIEITATGDWLALPRGQREAQLSEVFAIWAAALGEGRSITVLVVDKDGAQSMSMLR